ncbi:hypothetical protein A9W96_27355 [Mycobacterium sp. 1245852.3]|nr:hypothetical protein A9W96_27355 [Mycobacterium sp. 1245852.3]
MRAVAGFCSRHAGAIVLVWLVLAIAGNVCIPQLERVVREHSRSFLPANSPSSVAISQMGEIFGDSKTNNLAYVVMEAPRDLNAADFGYYQKLVAALTADRDHVEALMDLWADPLAASAAESPDKRAASVLLRLRGQLGTTEAHDAVGAVRHDISEMSPPRGLNVYLTGPGPTVADELGSMDNQLLITIISTAVLIAILLILVYRSVVSSRIPLIPVAAALFVARPVVALLGQHDVIEVSIFCENLLASVTLGAVTNYGIFMVGRYHEQRRRGLDPDSALATAYESVGPVIVASALTIALALSALSCADLGLLRSAGIPCAVSILIGMLAALTLLPALIGIAGRRGFAEPRPSPHRRQWRRLGVAVARWPIPMVIVATAVLVLFATPTLAMQIGFNEMRAQPASTESNRGYQAMDRHFPPNRLLPEIVVLTTDHDLRTPAGLIAIERVSRKILEQPGVQLIQTPSRPAGTPLTDAAITSQVGQIGDRFGGSLSAMTGQLDSINKLPGSLSDMASSIERLKVELASGSKGLRRVAVGTSDMSAGVQQLQVSAATLSGYLDPLRRYVGSRPECAGEALCGLLLKVIDPIDAVIAGTTHLTSGAGQAAQGASDTTSVLAGASGSLQGFESFLSETQRTIASVSTALDSLKPQMADLSSYLQEMGRDFQDSGEGGFYLPKSALEDRRFQHVSQLFFSKDGKSVRLLVFGDGDMFGDNGARLAADIPRAIQSVTKEGPLAQNSLLVAGVGSVVGELQSAVRHDFLLLATVALALVLLIVLLMLRAPVAALAVVATVMLSYLSAMGLSVIFWQFLLGQELHWAVLPIAFIALVAVGADYNLLLTARLKQECTAGLRSGMIRTFDGTGSVVTTAGIVFGVTMFALVRSNMASVAQIGTTVGLGLMVDTLLVRSVLVPGLASLFGRWFWWPFPLRHAKTGLVPRPRASHTSG